jgi:hypothetical protein
MARAAAFREAVQSATEKCGLQIGIVVEALRESTAHLAALAPGPGRWGPGNSSITDVRGPPKPGGSSFQHGMCIRLVRTRGKPYNPPLTCASDQVMDSVGFHGVELLELQNQNL